MCTSRCFDGTDACSEIAIWMDVRESRCTCRSVETTDKCGVIAIWVGVWEIGCTCRLGKTADACGGELVDADELGRWLMLVSWRGGEMPMRGVM